MFQSCVFFNKKLACMDRDSSRFHADKGGCFRTNRGLILGADFGGFLRGL